MSVSQRRERRALEPLQEKLCTWRRRIPAQHLLRSGRALPGGQGRRLAVVELEVLLYAGQLPPGDGSNVVAAYMANPATWAPPRGR